MAKNACVKIVHDMAMDEDPTHKLAVRRPGAPFTDMD